MYLTFVVYSDKRKMSSTSQNLPFIENHPPTENPHISTKKNPSILSPALHPISVVNNEDVLWTALIRFLTQRFTRLSRYVIEGLTETIHRLALVYISIYHGLDSYTLHKEGFDCLLLSVVLKLCSIPRSRQIGLN